MKPIVDFIQENDKITRLSVNDTIILCQQNDYYEYNFLCIVDPAIRYTYLKRCRDWLEEKYPNDYFEGIWSIMFTSKEIAILMKLSVE